MRISHLVYGFICFGALVFAGVYWDYLSFLVLTSCLVLPLLLYVQVRMVAKKLKFSMTVAQSSVHKKEDVSIHFILENTSWMPAARVSVQYYLTNTFYKQVTHHLVYLLGHAKNKQEIEILVQPQHVGILKLEVEEVLVYDFLRLFCVKVPHGHLQHETAVGPRILNSSAGLGERYFYPVDDSDLFSKTRMGSDPSEILRIRPYQPGDRLNRIHWKLSAKEGDLVVKDLGLPVRSDTYMLLELFSPEGREKENIDGMLESVCLLSMLFLKEGVEHIVFWYDVVQKKLQKQPISSIEEMYAMLDQILKMTIYDDRFWALENFDEQFQYVFGQSSKNFYMTPHFAEANIRQLSLQKKSNLTVFLIDDFKQQDMPDLTKIGCKAYVVDCGNPVAAFNEIVL